MPSIAGWNTADDEESDEINGTFLADMEDSLEPRRPSEGIGAEPLDEGLGETTPTLGTPAVDKLQIKILLLEHQLRYDRSHLQLYRLGAASFFVSIISLAMWFTSRVGVPFHPVFAAVVAPVSVGLMLMGYLVKSKNERELPIPGNVPKERS